MIKLIIGLVAGIAIGGAGKWTWRQLKKAAKRLKEVRKQWRD